jgi:hypothetical protein
MESNATRWSIRIVCITHKLDHTKIWVRNELLTQPTKDLRSEPQMFVCHFDLSLMLR